jgi:integrase
VRGYIRKRGKRSWELTVYRGKLTSGKWDRIIKNVKGSKRDADAALAELVKGAQAGSPIDDKKVNVAEFLETWLRDLASRVAPRTIERYRQIISLRVVPEFGHFRVSKLQPFQIQEIYAKWASAKRLDKRSGHLSPRSLLHHHRVLRNAFQHAVRMQLILRNPFDSVRPPKCANITMAVLDEDETARLIRAAQTTEIYTAVAIASFTGLRRGEILAVRWSDIDWDRRQLSVVRSLEQSKYGLRFKSPKTTKSRRTVSLGPLLIEILKRQKAEQARDRLKLGPDYSNNDLIVAQADGSPMKPQRLSDQFRALIGRAGVKKVRLHDIRHSHASHALRAGVHPKVVSERLGHASVGITLDLYSHVLEGLQEDGALKVDEALKAALAKLA